MVAEDDEAEQEEAPGKLETTAEIVANLLEAGRIATPHPQRPLRQWEEWTCLHLARSRVAQASARNPQPIGLQGTSKSSNPQPTGLLGTSKSCNPQPAGLQGPNKSCNPLTYYNPQNPV